MKTKLITLILLILTMSGCGSSNQTSKYVCDYSQYFSDYEKAEIEVNITYKEDILLYETNIQRFYFFDSTSSYQKEYLTKDVYVFDDGCFKVEMNVYDEYYEIVTTIDYTNLNDDYAPIFENTDGNVYVQESIEQLEANNCVLQ